MAEDRQALKVFISYARHDGAGFAEELLHGLEVAGFEAFLDRHDIAAGEDWEARLGGLIETADTVVFIVTPAAVASERCAWEVRKAEELSKRIIPIVAIDVPEADTPPGLTRLNYIFFTGGNSYSQKLGELARALRVDLNWIREHTRLAEQARRWRARDQSQLLLLRGGELDSARTWLAEWKEPAPEPSDLHRAFIAASESAEGQLVKLEKMRQRRLRMGLGGAAIVFAALALAATWFGVRAENQRRTAVEAQTRANREATAAREVETIATTALSMLRPTGTQSDAQLMADPRPLIETQRMALVGLALSLAEREMAKPATRETRFLAASLYRDAMSVDAEMQRSANRFFSQERSAQIYANGGMAFLEVAGLEGPAQSAEFGCAPGRADPNYLRSAVAAFQRSLDMVRSADALRGLGCFIQAQSSTQESEIVQTTSRAVEYYREAVALAPTDPRNQAHLDRALAVLREHGAAPPTAPTPPREQVPTSFSEGMIRNPVWIERPTAEAFARAYPTAALEREQEGRVLLDCIATANGGVTSCTIVEEDPVGFGFGEAAVRMSSQMRMQPTLDDGRSVEGGHVRFRLSFRLG